MSSEEIIIRRAAVGDIPALCELERECFSLPWSERAFEDFFALEHSVAYAALSGDRVVGYAGMFLSFGDGDITNIAVTRGFRRRGIGARLVRTLGGTLGVERLFLEVRASNTAARLLYEREGFEVDGIRKGFYANPREDAVLMSLAVRL